MNVIGLSLPNINKPYVHAGVVQAVVLWNTRDLGYLTVLAASQLTRERARRRRAHRSMPAVSARSRCAAREIILGAPLLITKNNIDTFDF